jgi:hypothetical protein
MKRKLSTLFVMTLALGALAWTPPTAFCFGCTAADKHYCTERALQDLNDCFQFYGSDLGMMMCANTYEESERACLIVKGCPVPIRNP